VLRLLLLLLLLELSAGDAGGGYCWLSVMSIHMLRLLRQWLPNWARLLLSLSKCDMSAGDAGGGYCWRPAVRVLNRGAEQPSGAQVQLRRRVDATGHYRT
jgi:hypothetical protein